MFRRILTRFVGKEGTFGKAPCNNSGHRFREQLLTSNAEFPRKIKWRVSLSENFKKPFNVLEINAKQENLNGLPLCHGIVFS